MNENDQCRHLLANYGVFITVLQLGESITHYAIWLSGCLPCIGVHIIRDETSGKCQFFYRDAL